MLVLLLFLGDFPSEGKIKDEGLTTLFHERFGILILISIIGGGVSSGFRIVQSYIFWCQHRWG